MAFSLLSTGNPKTLKGEKKGFMTYIMHLSPSTLAGAGNTCPMATSGCKAACLNTAGRGGMISKETGTNVIQEARKRKTRLFFNDRGEFMRQLVVDIEKAIKQATRKGFVPVFRLNGTSDISFEKYPVIRDGVEYSNIFRAFPDVQFYDYTKVPGRKISDIPNYHLTFSAADGNDSQVAKAIAQGLNIAVVFRVKKGEPLPDQYLGRQVVDGDESDLRFLDAPQSVVGLIAKGKARKDTSGFVKDPA